MSVIKIRYFESNSLKPLNPLDGTSLEEQMNAFITTILIANLVDVETIVTHIGQGSRLVFIGVVIYQT